MEIPKITEKDKKLLAKLHEDGRTSHKQLGNAMRASSETARYRLKRLRDKDILDSVIPIIDMSRLGFTTYRVQIRYHDHEEERINELKTYCKNQSETSWIVDLAGNWDFVALFQASTVNQFNTVYEDMLDSYGDLIRDKQLTIVTSITHLPPAYITERDGSTYTTGLTDETASITDKQHRILEHLLSDGRRNLSRIAESIDISISTVRYHLNELEDKSVIKAYKPVINAERLGYDHYKVMFELANPGDKDTVRRRLKDEASVIYITESLGTYDIECEAYYRRVNGVIRLIEDLKQRTDIKEFTIIYDNDEQLINALPR